jgi:hypothetical protein
MADRFYAGAYWGPRAESSAQCAARLEACLRSLGRSHEVLSRWYRKGTSRSAASGRPIDIDADTLESLLSGGRNRTDVGGEVIAELGFSLALWNNNPHDGVVEHALRRHTYHGVDHEQLRADTPGSFRYGARTLRRRHGQADPHVDDRGVAASVGHFRQPRDARPSEHCGAAPCRRVADVRRGRPSFSCATRP